MTRYTMQNKVVTAIQAAALTSAIGLFSVAQLHAQEAHSTTGEYSNEYVHDDHAGALRIDMAGEFRALSQRIPAVACIMLYTDDREDMEAWLVAAMTKFDEDLEALHYGNPEMGIFGVEEQHRVLQHFETLTALWDPFHVATQNLVDGKDVEASMAFISENNMDLLELAKELVTEISSEYANPIDITGSEALLIDFAGRQRMLTQKIAKESCGVVTGNDPLGHVDDLNKTVALYEITLRALHDGMPAVGVIPPPTAEIKLALEEAVDHWDEIKDVIAHSTGKGSVDREGMIHLIEQLDEKRAKMSAITHLYSTYAAENE